MDDYVDIYSDLCEVDLGTQIIDLQQQNEKARKHIAYLETDIKKFADQVAQLKRTQETLTRNISELFNTAKNEIERKNRIIDDLRNQLDKFQNNSKFAPVNYRSNVTERRNLCGDNFSHRRSNSKDRYQSRSDQSSSKSDYTSKTYHIDNKIESNSSSQHKSRSYSRDNRSSKDKHYKDERHKKYRHDSRERYYKSGSRERRDNRRRDFEHSKDRKNSNDKEEDKKYDNRKYVEKVPDANSPIDYLACREKEELYDMNRRRFEDYPGLKRIDMVEHKNEGIASILNSNDPEIKKNYLEQNKQKENSVPNTPLLLKSGLSNKNEVELLEIHSAIMRSLEQEDNCKKRLYTDTPEEEVSNRKKQKGEDQTNQSNNSNCLQDGERTPKTLIPSKYNVTDQLEDLNVNDHLEDKYLNDRLEDKKIRRTSPRKLETKVETQSILYTPKHAKLRLKSPHKDKPSDKRLNKENNIEVNTNELDKPIVNSQCSDIDKVVGNITENLCMLEVNLEKTRVIEDNCPDYLKVSLDTTEDLQNCLESPAKPILSSLKDSSNDLQNRMELPVKPASPNDSSKDLQNCSESSTNSIVVSNDSSLNKSNSNNTSQNSTASLSNTSASRRRRRWVVKFND